MSLDSSNIVVREALPGDYLQVAEINTDVYGGFDYLMPIYHWMLQTKNNHPFVALIEDKVVGFINLHILRGGKICLKTSTRVSPAYQGRGVKAAMEKHSMLSLSDEYPLCTTTVWTSVKNDGEDRFLEKHSGQFELLMKWNLMQFITSPLELQSMWHTLASSTSSRHIPLSPALAMEQDIKQFITSFNQSSFFIACPLQVWGVWQTTDAELRHVLKTSDVIASFETTDTERHLSAVGFLSAMRCSRESNVSATLVFYGKCFQDLLDHIKICIKHIQEVIPPNAEEICLLIHYPLNFQADDLTDFIVKQTDQYAKRLSIHTAQLISTI